MEGFKHQLGDCAVLLQKQRKKSAREHIHHLVAFPSPVVKHHFWCAHGGGGGMHLRGSESIPRPLPATFHWLHSLRSENNHSLQKITTENNTHRTFLLWTWGHGTTLLPQPARAHLGGLPCTQWYQVYFQGLNLHLRFSTLPHMQEQLERSRGTGQQVSPRWVLTWPYILTYLYKVPVIQIPSLQGQAPFCCTK